MLNNSGADYAAASAIEIVCRRHRDEWRLLADGLRDSFNWIGLGNTPNWDDHSGLYGNWGTIALPTAASDVEFGQFFTRETRICTGPGLLIVSIWRRAAALR